jgi:hypothetical protein
VDQRVRLAIEFLKRHQASRIAVVGMANLGSRLALQVQHLNWKQLFSFFFFFVFSLCHLLLLAHGKVLSTLLSIILEGYSHSNPVRGLKNTSVTHVQFDPVTDKFSLVVLNCSAHLSTPASSL